MFWKYVLFPVLAVASVLAQDAILTTYTDPNNGGATEVLSISSDGVGDIYTNTISTITDAGASATSNTPSTTLTPPTASGTALPPFSSLSVQSGSVVAYSDFTATGEPTTSTASTGAASALSLGFPPLVVPAAILGGIGLGIGLL